MIAAVSPVTPAFLLLMIVETVFEIGGTIVISYAIMGEGNTQKRYVLFVCGAVL